MNSNMIAVGFFLIISGFYIYVYLRMQRKLKDIEGFNPVKQNSEKGLIIASFGTDKHKKERE